VLKNKHSSSPVRWHADPVQAIVVLTCILAIAWSAISLLGDKPAGVPAVAISLVAAILAFRSERIAARVERSFRIVTAEAPVPPLLESVQEAEPVFATETLAIQAFGDRERALQWMAEGNPALQGRTPMPSSKQRPAGSQ